MSIPPIPEGLPDTLEVRVANSLHSVAIHLLRRARRSDAEVGLSAERLSLLSVLAYAGPATMSGLAEAEMVSRPAITRTVHALVEEGLVVRERDPEDRRRVIVRATSRGRSLMETGRCRRVERVAKLLGEFSPRTLKKLEEAVALLDGVTSR